MDDDCNGLIDCSDPACSADPQCAIVHPEICDNGRDDNGDGRVDCDDPACAGFPGCFVIGREICNNGLDDNLDKLVDCADPQCVGTYWCTAPAAEICDNGVDDNGDGLVDCVDPKCAAFPACVKASCLAESDFGVISPRGASVTQTISTSDAVSSFDTCAPPGGRGRVATFQLTATTDLRIDVAQDGTSAHVVAVFRAGAGQICDETTNLVSCLDAGQDTSSNYSLRGLTAGTYWLIVQSYPLSQGAAVVTLSTGSASQNEICNNGLDDDGNGLADCSDTACESDPSCVASVCVSDKNIGVLVVDGDHVNVNFDTSTTENRYHPNCAGTSTAGDYAIQFTLKEPAGVAHAQWTDSGNRTISLFRAPGPGRACDGGEMIRCGVTTPASNFIWPNLGPGDYLIIAKPRSESDEGPWSLQIWATSDARGVEKCGDGIDNDGDLRVDCNDEDCFGKDPCQSPICMPDVDLGHFSVGTTKNLTADTTGALNLYGTRCGRGDGAERVYRFTLDEPMGFGVRCSSDGGDNVLQLTSQARPLDACDAQRLICADPINMGCNFVVVNMQPGKYNLIVEAFQSGSEGATNLQLSGMSDAVVEICNNGIDDDNDGQIDCADRKCITSPMCVKYRCVPLKDLGLLPLDGTKSNVTVDTTASGHEQLAACASVPGGQDVDVDFQLPADADVTFAWQQSGDHVLALYKNAGQLFACDDSSSFVDCHPTGGSVSDSYTLSKLPAGRYHLVVDANQPGAEGGLLLSIAAVPPQP